MIAKGFCLVDEGCCRTGFSLLSAALGSSEWRLAREDPTKNEWGVSTIVQQLGI
jgi:hypothetical protein